MYPDQMSIQVSMRGPNKLPVKIFCVVFSFPCHWRHKKLLWTVYIKIRLHRMCSLISYLHYPAFCSRLLLNFLSCSRAICDHSKRIVYSYNSVRVKDCSTFVWFDYFRLFIVATGCPSERRPQKTVSCYWEKCKDTGPNYFELRLVL